MRIDEPDAGITRTFALGAGRVALAGDGLVVAVTAPDGRPFLLREDADAPESDWHDADHRWGSGFWISDRGAGRWQQPAALTWHPDGVDTEYCFDGLRLRVSRRFGEAWRETYRLVNEADDVRIGCLAVSTPWRDVYPSAPESLAGAVHAHLWTGGSDSWVWAQPMDGSGPGLGLRLTHGGLHAYSVESRNPFTGSNVRGHCYLHVTDHRRQPDAMGGQPELRLAAGDSHVWAWTVSWHESEQSFHADADPIIRPSVLAVPLGDPLGLGLRPGATWEVEPDAVQGRVGIHHLWARDGDRRSRVSVAVHPPLRELVEARIRFLLDRQRPTERPGSRASAFVPFDTETGLRTSASGWADWNDGRERIGSAQLLLEARRRGWGRAGEIDVATRGYRLFLLDHLLGADGTVRDGSASDRVRLYNFPWFARYLLDTDPLGLASEDAISDLDRAVLIMDRYYASGGDHFLAFGVGSVLADLSERLAADGRSTDAERMRTSLVQHARRFVSAGTELPAHEVNYEQSMVAPLLDLLLQAHRIDPDAVPATELRRRLPWLTAFAGQQPDVRMQNIPIRHWDGYWFGRERLWGDVFPHYWSVLSAGVFLDWPDGAGGPEQREELARRGRAILRANLVDFDLDGTASCAFVYPSAVDGRAAHRADPLINDQDWALVYALRYGL